MDLPTKASFLPWRTVASCRFIHIRERTPNKPSTAEPNAFRISTPRSSKECPLPSVSTFVAEKCTTTPSAEAAATPPQTGGELPESGSPPVLGGVDGLPGRGGHVLNTFAPIDILDYIYAVLHSPTYREKYKEFLKIDFPRVPYPKDAETFWQIVALGGELRQIHLLESRVVEKFITGYPVDGDNIVVRPHFLSEPGTVVTGAVDTPGVESAALEKSPVATAPGTDTLARGDVYINDTQYFQQRPRNRVELLHRRLPTRPKMAKRP